jgi:predicted transcriptional regulator
MQLSVDEIDALIPAMMQDILARLPGMTPYAEAMAADLRERLLAYEGKAAPRYGRRYDANGKQLPAVPVEHSVSPDEQWLFNLEDGKPVKNLRLDLAKWGITPDEYRTKWGLPDDYPMQAPAWWRGVAVASVVKAGAIAHYRKKAGLE